MKGLYRQGLIYFDVPVYPDDRFKGNCVNCEIVILWELVWDACFYMYKAEMGGRQLRTDIRATHL